MTEDNFFEWCSVLATKYNKPFLYISNQFDLMTHVSKNHKEAMQKVEKFLERSSENEKKQMEK